MMGTKLQKDSRGRVFSFYSFSMGHPNQKQDKIDKRAEALRENLRKRKALKKEQKAQDKASEKSKEEN